MTIGLDLIDHVFELNGEVLGNGAGLLPGENVVNVNSRPMYTSDSRIDGYHQKECGGS
jgi:hypothetical protein